MPLCLVIFLFFAPFANAQSSKVLAIQDQIQSAKASGLHTWVQVLDDRSTQVTESKRFEDSVFTPSFKSRLNDQGFSVIEIRSSEIETDPSLLNWLKAFKPDGRLATFLLDNEGALYLKQNPSEAIKALAGQSDSQLSSHFLNRANKLKSVRSGVLADNQKKQAIKNLPFLSPLMTEARLSQKPVIVNLVPSNLENSSMGFNHHFDTVFGQKHQKAGGVPFVPAAVEKTPKRLKPNLDSLVSGPAEKQKGTTEAPSNKYLVKKISLSPTGSFNAEESRLFDLLGKTPQHLLAVIQPDGTVDTAVNPQQWINQNKKSLGGLIRVDDVENLEGWLTQQPAIVRERERSSYCGGYLNFVSGFDI